MDKVRIQLDFSLNAVKELDEMKELMGVGSRAEVLRHALRWMRWTVLNLAEGGRLLIEKNNEQREIVLPFAKPEAENQSKTTYAGV
jgi:predicted RNA-binding protein with PUA domain